MGLLEEIRKIIEDYFSNSTFTSANPRHTNVVRDIVYSYEPDEAALRAEGEPQEPVEPIPSGNLPGGSAIDIRTGRTVAGGLSNPLNLLEKLFPIAKLIPIIATILAIPATIEVLRRIMHTPGFPLDPRFRRDIQDEVISSLERADKAKLRQGLIIIRITANKAQRGEQGIGQTGQVGITGIARYDQDYESFQKGVL